jgi:hypothetical protein
LTTATELIQQGKKAEVWKKYCGFLDLSMDEFMDIQEHLLMEQIQLISKNYIGQYFMGDRAPRSVEEFRWKVPITTYDSYEQFFGREDRSYPDTYCWAHTSGRSGKFKWVPYTRRSYQKMGERIFAQLLLGAARERGDINLKVGDVLVYNTPPRPYISEHALLAAGGEFAFNFVPPMDKTEEMDFQERIKVGFKMAMESGIDVLGSMSSVLVKMGESFGKAASGGGMSRSMLKPKILMRFGRAYLKSKRENRGILPKDLWNVKTVTCAGADSVIYRDKIIHYWGVAPYESYGCTEEGVIATQNWNQKYLTFMPSAAFFEFIPEEEWAKWRRDPLYIPQTVLYNEVAPNKRYEVVISNFYGKPFLRYRTYDVVHFPLMEDPETGCKLPQMGFVSRASDFIDLAGWTGLIDEKMVWQAIINSGVNYVDWAIRKESAENEPYLRLYIEPIGAVEPEMVRQKVNTQMKLLNPFYADYENMIEKRALEVTVLSTGTFQRYMLEKQKAGADLAHLKPAHMNASEEVVELLLRCSEGIGTTL